MLNMSVNILEIIEINEKDGFMRVKLDTDRFWFDRKLTYQNLLQYADNDLSPEDQELIWKPWTVYQNMESRAKIEETEQKPIYRILPNANFSYQKGRILSPDNTYIFPGSENIIQYKREYTVEWLCDFHMAWFPFDTQSCTLQFFQAEEVIDFVPNTVSYSGPKTLPQHFVQDVTICSFIISGKKGILVEVVLSRPIFSNVLTITLPTAMLVIISIFIIGFSKGYLDMVINVNLTVLLVLATL